jgi:membrane-bound serine protease (ClpP class)
MIPRPAPSHRARRAAAVAFPLIALSLLLPWLAVAQPQQPQPPRKPGEVILARVDSIIHPVSAEFIRDAIAEADRSNAAALVVELSTPGGLMSSTREITTAMLGARTPVVVYVGPNGAQCASAGFFILMASDVAAMAPDTNTGAAHPVGGGGEDIGGTLGKKVEEDAAANIRALAARNGRNVELAQAAVVESRSFTAQEALQQKLVEIVAPSVPELLKAIDGRQVRRGNAIATLRTAGAAVREIELSPMRRFLGLLADPNVAYMLLTLGGLGLIFELKSPGAILPGVVGGICLILAFFAMSVLPVNTAGLALIALALVFFIAELKVVSHGLLAAGGLISLVIGSLMLFKTPDAALEVSLGLIATLTAFTAAVIGLLLFMAIRAQRLPVQTGREGLLQELGVARTPIDPRGKVLIHGEIWDAVADEPVRAGETVQVLGMRNLTLAVRAQPRDHTIKETV